MTYQSMLRGSGGSRFRSSPVPVPDGSGLHHLPYPRQDLPPERHVLPPTPDPPSASAWAPRQGHSIQGVIMTIQTEEVSTRNRLRYFPVAVALAGFLAVSFAVCVAWDAVFPQWAMRSTWAPLLPGFEWLSVASFLLGLAEAVVYGFWLALVVPLVQWTNRLFSGRRGVDSIGVTK